MVATLSVRFDWGGADTAPGNETDVDYLGPPRLLFKLADNATIDENNQLVIPGLGDGPYTSFWKHVYLYCDDPDGNTISAVKFYSDGANGLGTGCALYVGNETPTKNSGSDAGYEVAVVDGAEPNSGEEMVANHASITGRASVFTYTVGAGAKSVSISEAGAVINAVGETSDYLVLQFETSDTASEGLTGLETLYLSYTEA